MLKLGDIPHEDAKLMTADQIISLYNFDHYPIRHVDGGPAEPWNLEPVLIKPHRVKTAKVDRPQIAKDRRVSAKWAAFQAKMNEQDLEKPSAAKIDYIRRNGGNPEMYRKRKWPSRPFPKREKKHAR